MVGLSGPPKITDREAPDALIAEHGFSMLVTVTKAGYQHRVPFDAGTSPNGVAERMRRLDIDPTDLEAGSSAATPISTTPPLWTSCCGCRGRWGLPVLIHPHFWRRRRAVCPGRELPTASPPRF